MIMHIVMLTFVFMPPPCFLCLLALFDVLFSCASYPLSRKTLWPLNRPQSLGMWRALAATPTRYLPTARSPLRWLHVICRVASLEGSVGLGRAGQFHSSVTERPVRPPQVIATGDSPVTHLPVVPSRRPTPALGKEKRVTPGNISIPLVPVLSEEGMHLPVRRFLIKVGEE